ncbi:peptidylprolyl isomerase [Jeotgalibacillus sp. R-1-5s-1]|uniref:peptidylprolyl isomerase n=1 Tax=Jeotgalibacillus sp. R-1-5s-1 TaxID=2555897 RepID=UPI00106C8954|nr:peptidylprolyl isomerase [Jeotgalibacillus sp. R-1-5s-1]TFD95946.1 peptidylprolyl isomerase [Jeotgalibacillus sp. R-1-5s-1]
MKIKLMLSLLFVLLLAACGGNADSGSDTENTESAEPAEETAEDTYAEAEPVEELPAVEGYPQTNPEPGENEPVATIQTNYGDITVKFFPDQAPLAVENFLTHAEEGYYDGVIFHRVIEDFMIQGGDPDGTGAGGESIFGEPFEDEFSPELVHIRGALSMANSGPATNGSQFFIVQNQNMTEDLVAQMESAGFPEELITMYQERGGTPYLDNRHTVFGQVIEGMNIVDNIAAVETGSDDRPVEEVVIESVEVQE